MTDFIYCYINIMQGVNNHNHTQPYKVLNILISIIILKLLSSYSRGKEVKFRNDSIKTPVLSVQSGSFHFYVT